MPDSILMCFPLDNPLNLPGMKRTPTRKCMRFTPQTYYFALVQTGKAKEFGKTLDDVRVWFREGNPGVRRRAYCSDCPYRPADYVPPPHLAESGPGDGEELAEVAWQDVGTEADVF